MISLKVHKKGKEICIVVGGGNIFRGISGAAQGIDRVTADGMGMLATVYKCFSTSKCYRKKWYFNKSIICYTHANYL